MIEVIYVSCDKSEEDFKKTYAKMPWVTAPYNNSFHKDLLSKYEITGVPFIYVLDAATGFLISKKGRKDIAELGVDTMKAWQSEHPIQLKKHEHLKWGASVVEAARVAAEEEAKRKA